MLNPFYLLSDGFEVLSPMLQMEKPSYATSADIRMAEPCLTHNESQTLGQVRSFFHHCATQVKLGVPLDSFLLDARYRLTDWFESIIMKAAPLCKGSFTDDEWVEFWYLKVSEFRTQLEAVLNKWSEEERPAIKFVLLDLYDGENGPRSQLPFYKEIASNKDVWLMLAAALLSINELFFSYLKEPTPIGLRHETMVIVGQIPWHWAYKQFNSSYLAEEERRTEFFEFLKEFKDGLPDSPIRALAVMADWGTDEEAALPNNENLTLHNNYDHSIRYCWPDNNPFPFTKRDLEWRHLDHVIHDSYVSSCGYRGDQIDWYVERSITDNLLALFLMTPADAASGSFEYEAGSEYVGGFYYGSSCYGGDNDYYREQAYNNNRSGDLPDLGGDSDVVRDYFFKRGLARASVS
jgi:hypothetical protein